MNCDFITTYANYADVLEAPRIFHEITAIQLVATALNRSGVTIPFWPARLSLDLQTVLLSGSGGGRTTTVALARPILEAAQMDDLESSVRWGSATAFYQHFAGNPCGLHVWGEMAEMLKLLNEPRFATVKQWLTDRYDNFKIPAPFRYRVTGKKADTPPIVFTQAPRINILATSAGDWFFRNLAEEDSTGGLIARWVIMQADGKRRDVPIPRTPDQSLIEPLAQRLAEIGRLSGEADLSAIFPLYETWYVPTKRRFEAQPNGGLAMAYFNRHRIHVLKLAVIFEASQSAALKVPVEAWERAVEFAGLIEQSIFRLLPTGMSAAGHDQQKIEDRIRRAGAQGVSRSDLTRAFQSMPQKNREQHLETLETAGRIRCVKKLTATRQALIYVHEEFRSHGQ